MAFTSLTWFDLVLLAFASWSLANMTAREQGPWRIFERFREAFPLGGLTACIYCTVRWIALFLFVVHLFAPAVTWVLAISGAALMLRSYTGVGHDV